jgi:5S rRNA maturation endonuclease (ribonuclease M5)
MMNSFEEWINELQSSNKLILVEGEKDQAALNALGITNILAVSKKPTYKIIENINNKEVIILTDLDREGKKLYSILRHHLQKQGVKIDVIFREFLFRETTLMHIEGLSRYLRKTSYNASKMGTPVSKL